MFEAEIGSAGQEKSIATERLAMIKKVVESLSDIVDQMGVRCSDKGLNIQVMDSMHVALIDIFFSRNNFSSFRCDRDLELGIPLKHFITILRGINLEEKSILRFSAEDNPSSLKIQHFLPDSEYEFDISLYQIGSDNFEVPQMEYESNSRLPTDSFRNITKLIGSFGEYISFGCEKNVFLFNQKGDMVKNRMQLRSNDETVFVDSVQPVQLEIAMKYVNIINKVSSLSNEISIGLGSACPAYFDLRLYDLGHIKFYVAPKVDG